MDETIVNSNHNVERVQNLHGLAKTAAQVGTAISIWAGLRMIFLLLDITLINRLQAGGASDNTLQIIDLAFSAVGVYIIATPIALWVLGMFRNGNFKALFVKSRLSGKELAAAIPMGYTVTIAVNLVVTIITLLASKSLDDIINGNPLLNLPKGGLGVALNYAWAVLIAPIFEEILFRGALLKNLSRYGNWFAVITSAVLFGLAHGNIAQMLYATALGIALGMVFVKAGSVIPCIIMHFSINFLGITISTFFSKDTMGVVALLGMLVLAALIAGVVLIIITLVNYRDKLKLGNSCNTLSRGEKVLGLLKSPQIIFMLALTLSLSIIANVPSLMNAVTELLK